tara:strand:+ start:18865 stop:19650 length:786 start_codon:yes stop_codon:yes gene_type:complete
MMSLIARVLFAMTIIVLVVIAITTNLSNNSKVKTQSGQYPPHHYIQYVKTTSVPSPPYDADNLIPKVINQIWIGSREPPAQIQLWKDLSTKYGYTHRLWRESDIDTFGLVNRKYYDEMIATNRYAGASDVARYEILNAHGGIYCDADISPVDLPIFDYLPDRGFGVSLEHHPIKKSLGAGAIFTANGFMVSCPNHPILSRVIESLPLNYESFRSINHINEFMTTGPYLLTACLFGIYSIIDKNWIMTDQSNPEFHLTEFNN